MSPIQKQALATKRHLPVHAASQRAKRRHALWDGGRLTLNSVALETGFSVESFTMTPGRNSRVAGAVCGGASASIASPPRSGASLGTVNAPGLLPPGEWHCLGEYATAEWLGSSERFICAMVAFCSARYLLRSRFHSALTKA